MVKQKKQSPQIAYRKNACKGKLFEFIIREWIEQAGFKLNPDIPQLTQVSSKKRLHGRGGTYDPDFIAEFPITIPFSYPFLLVGEAKNYSHPIQIKQVREFLGAFIDLSQYSRINIKSRSLTKYSQIFNEKRYNYIPVFYSVSGFAKNAQALMWAHGIYFVSYENSVVINDIKKKMDFVLNQIDYGKLTNEDVWKLKEFLDFEKIPQITKKNYYDSNLSKLKNNLKPINSYFGLLDNIWPIHFIVKYKTKIKPFIKIKECSYIINNNQITLKKTLHPNSKSFGFFSLPKYFLDEYQKISKKKNKDCLSEILLFVKEKDKIFPQYIKLKQSNKLN